MSAPAVSGGSGAGSELHEYVAPYLGAREPARLAACRAALAADPRLPYLAHYTEQTCNFAVDRLAAFAARLDARPEWLRREILEVGDELVYRLKDFDQRLAVAQSGALIRTVYQTARGALYCYAVVPGEYLVAFSIDDAAEPDDREPLTARPVGQHVDAAVAALTTALRRELSRGDQNPGGFGTLDLPSAEPTEPLVHEGVEIGPVAAACRRALSVTDLHYVAWIRNREPAYAADLLGSPQLARFFPKLDVTPAVRREFYGKLAKLLGRLSPELSALVEPVAGEPLLRVVLDVEEGAVYWYRLAPGQFLIGATLDQNHVSAADDVLAKLTVSIQN